MNLDDLQAMAGLDSGAMAARISELPGQCRSAWEQAESLKLPQALADVDRVVIVGMGGSAIGGALLRDLVADEITVPISVVRGYTLPRFVWGARTLVVACSHSGNTEETLSCFKQAVDRGAQVLAITTGGKLADRADRAGAAVIRFDYQSQPRAALGYSFILLLGAVHQLGLVRDFTEDVAEASAGMEAWQAGIAPEIPTGKNAAKQLATKTHGKLPVIYGAGFLGATANRWKTQFNENAKSWAFFEVLPELNHNAVVGLTIPEIVRDRSLVIALRSPLDPERLTERWDVTREVLEREGVAAEEVWGRGESRLAQMMSLIHFGDYVSYYAAVLNQVDPTPVDTIAFLKDRLADLGKVVE